MSFSEDRYATVPAQQHHYGPHSEHQRDAGFGLFFSEDRYADGSAQTASLWTTLALARALGFRGFICSIRHDTPEKTIPQGKDPPGADNGEQSEIPPQVPRDKEVIPPPPIGDEDIHIQAPNPEAET